VVNLGAGTYYSVGAQGGTGTGLSATNVGGRPGGVGPTARKWAFYLRFV
jgi:hypothetical protein